MTPLEKIVLYFYRSLDPEFKVPAKDYRQAQELFKPWLDSDGKARTLRVYIDYAFSQPFWIERATSPAAMVKLLESEGDRNLINQARGWKKAEDKRKEVQEEVVTHNFKPIEVWDLTHETCRGKGTISIVNPQNPMFHLAEMCTCRRYIDGALGRKFHGFRNQSMNKEAMEIYTAAKPLT